ncbi:type II secretion system protein GspC [Vibrio cincinnatiensis]|uniref:type II secretion system protein GspC n=1 Tax=Vibrio cincinnatiensis TaxID=675 RepID=UPI001EDF2C1A|nr:type II secretion system protein GspC [Vibrio cincinnatiensis]MCG3736417.1 type II secretion system protein GspC [Vibrio cincinnatiensis]
MDLNRWSVNGSWSLFLRWQPPLSQALTIVGIVLSAWLVGQSIWLILQPKPSLTLWASTAVPPVSSPSRLNIQSLQNSELFGRYTVQTASPVTTVVKVDAPPTRLNLTLVGVVASTDQPRSLAVIANRGQQNTYGLNEEIEGTRAVLKAVFVDRVIIDNSGRDETLMLEGRDYQTSTIQTLERPVAVNSSVEDKLTAIRDEINRSPQEVFKYVSLSQVKQDESVIGYRVSPGKDPALFEAVGLQAGDIAIQLNGLDLTDPSVMTQVFESVSDLTELNLTVERDGQSHDIYIQF